jgi:hypothetical protein
MTANTAETWSYCSLRKDSNTLQLWFNFGLSMSSECGIKMVAALGVCTKNEQHQYPVLQQFMYQVPNSFQGTLLIQPQHDQVSALLSCKEKF